jgi:hypothetical protein
MIDQLPKQGGGQLLPSYRGALTPPPSAIANNPVGTHLHGAPEDGDARRSYFVRKPAHYATALVEYVRWRNKKETMKMETSDNQCSTVISLPVNWSQRPLPNGGREYWRRGPNGSTLSSWQPHGTYWRMYVGCAPIVRSHHDRGIFYTPNEAMSALDDLAANGMQGALFD